MRITIFPGSGSQHYTGAGCEVCSPISSWAFNCTGLPQWNCTVEKIARQWDSN